MSTGEITAYTIAGLVIVVCLIIINCWIEAERILNWYIREYNSRDRVMAPKKRRPLHRKILSLFTFPVAEDHINLKDTYNNQLN